MLYVVATDSVNAASISKHSNRFKKEWNNGYRSKRKRKKEKERRRERDFILFCFFK